MTHPSEQNMIREREWVSDSDSGSGRTKGHVSVSSSNTSGSTGLIGLRVLGIIECVDVDVYVPEPY